MPAARWQSRASPADSGADLPGVTESIVRDIHGQGSALARRKYRLLRWSYSAPLIGVSASATVLFAQLLIA